MARDLIVAPEAVKQFVRTLRRYSDEMASQTRKVCSDLDGLGGDWRDRKYDKFRAEMQSVARDMKARQDMIRDYAAHLEDFARRAQDALDRRVPGE